MFHTRHTHQMLNGQKRLVGEDFDLDDGDKLEYPGDPKGRAENVINCYCQLIPHVLLRNERLVDNEVVYNNEQAQQTNPML